MIDDIINRGLQFGAHDSPEQGACLMEVASLLTQDEFSDLPLCTHEVVALVAQRCNDRMGDGDRDRLLHFLPRILRARRVDPETDRRIAVRMAVLAARRVLHLFEDAHPGDPRPREAIEAAEAWLETGVAAVAAAAADAAADAGAATYAARAASYAATHAADTASYAASSAASSAAAAYAAARASASTATTDPETVLDQTLDDWAEAAKAEDIDLWIPTDWEDQAVAFCAALFDEGDQ